MTSNPITAFDEFLLDRFQELVEFMNDWAGISQRMLEIGSGAIWACCALALSIHKGVLVVVAAVMVGIAFVGIVLQANKSSKEKARNRASLSALFFRLLWLFLIVMDVIWMNTDRSKEIRWDVLSVIVDVSLASNLYINACGNDGSKRGCKAKMTWEKFEELFGTKWVPQEEGV